MFRVLWGSVAILMSLAPTAHADIIFTTESTATQTITSPLFGGSVSITANGPQLFTIDPASGFAAVTSDFHGSDLPDPLNPGHYLSYALHNTQTTGTVVPAGPGLYDVTFDAQFELRVTSGPLTGLTFETHDPGIFSAIVPAIPFPPGTAFSDPTPPDTLPIFVKVDPTDTFPPGTEIGTSSSRVVTINSAVLVPEPASVVLFACAGLFGAAWLRRREQRADHGP